jgi:tetratricopeptide (TPR) repeat protein
VMKNLGIACYYEKQYEKGVFLLEKCLTIKPNDPVAGLFIGLCYKELNKIDESIEYLNFASGIAIPYYMSDIYNQLGNNYLQKKEYRKSVDFLKKAYRLDTNKCEILFKIANTYDVWQKDKTPAIRYYNAYLKAKKEETDFYRQLTDYSVERITKLKK